MGNLKGFIDSFMEFVSGNGKRLALLGAVFCLAIAVIQLLKLTEVI